MQSWGACAYFGSIIFGVIGVWRFHSDCPAVVETFCIANEVPSVLLIAIVFFVSTRTIAVGIPVLGTVIFWCFSGCIIQVSQDRGDNMNIHEYQAKELLKQYKITIQDGVVLSDAVAAAEDDNSVQQQFNTQAVVIKAQIHAGVGVKVAALSFVQILIRLSRRLVLF